LVSNLTVSFLKSHLFVSFPIMLQKNHFNNLDLVFVSSFPLLPHSNHISIFFPLAFSLTLFVRSEKSESERNKICDIVVVAMSGKCISSNVYYSTLSPLLFIFPLSAQIKPFLCKLARGFIISK
jgi:hypothetical protein